LENALLVLDSRDNVAVALRDLKPCERIDAAGGYLVVRNGIRQGHKIATGPIAKGQAVVKYGVTIGRASADIAAGEHVHMHNLTSIYLDNEQNNTR
jgi:altronate hydrolase